MRRWATRVDEQLRLNYLSNASIRKLHVGSGPRCLPGWLNTDIAPSAGVMQMDATRPFPFVDAEFDYIFTEHMIEHIPFDDATYMLRECYRVLKQGGAIRVTTPDLASLVGLYGENLSELQQRYLDWFCKNALPQGHGATPANAINAMFRLWGHQYIYDENALTDALRKVGFIAIERVPLMRSGHSELENLENVERYPEGFLELESLALEALK